MSDRTKHRQLYKLIPSMDCIPGCTDCCGPVPLTSYEAQRFGLYENRPLMCRLFGTVDHPRMKCPHGKRPRVVISNGESREIMAGYYNIMDKNE